jgi:peptidoglycan hydrolase CwlO-like protein
MKKNALNILKWGGGILGAAFLGAFAMNIINGPTDLANAKTSFTSEINQIEKKLQEKISDVVSELSGDVSDVSERTGKLEAVMPGFQSQLNRIENKLDGALQTLRDNPNY